MVFQPHPQGVQPKLTTIQCVLLKRSEVETPGPLDFNMKPQNYRNHWIGSRENLTRIFFSLISGVSCKCSFQIKESTKSASLKKSSHDLRGQNLVLGRSLVGCTSSMSPKWRHADLGVRTKPPESGIAVRIGLPVATPKSNG